MNVTESGAAAAVSVNTTTFTGLTQLSAINAGTGTDTLTASATTSINDTLGAGGTDVINGGLNIAVTKTQVDAANATTFGTITIGGTTAAAGSVTVTNTDTNGTYTGFADTAITVTGGNGVTITDNVSSGVALGTANAITYTQKGSNGAVAINLNNNVSSAGAAQAVTGNAITVNGSGTATDAGATSITVNVVDTATQVAVTPSTITNGSIGITGGTATTSVTVNQSSTATAAATVAAVAGVVGVAAVAAAPGTSARAAVTAVTPVAAVTGKVGVVDGAVTIADINGASNTAANTLATVTLNSIGTGSQITSSALTTLNLGGVSSTGATLAIVDNLTANVSSNVLNLNTTAATGGVVITAGKVGTLNITNSGTSALGAFTDTNLKTVTVAGSGVVTLGANSATTETITGSAGVTQTIDNTVVTFTASGSTGTDTITTSTTGTKVITAGSGASDELILAANSTWTATTGGKFVGFEILGLNTSITQDASVFGSGINTLDITNTGETDVITKLNTNAGITLQKAATTTTSLTVGYVDTTGATDATTVTFAGPTASVVQTGAAQAITTLVLADANGIGVGTVNIVDNNVAFNYAGDSIATLTDTNVANLNFSGAGGFTLGGTSFANNVTSMTIGNTGTNAAGAIVTMTDNNLGNLTFTGTGKTTLNLTDTVAGTINITNSGTGAVSVSDGGANTVAANINLTGAMTATFTDTKLAAITLSANQTVTLTADESNIAAGANSGFTLSGAADNNRVAATIGAAAATKTNTITLGNGNNSIVDRTTAGTSNVTVGTGSNLINVGVTGGLNNSTGLFNITTGTHASTTVGNEIIVGTAGTNFATVAAYTLTGLTAGDQVAFLADAASIASGSQAATSLTGAANVAGAINTLETAAGTAHSTAWGVYGGDTYVVEDATGTNGAQATTVVVLKGLSSTTTGALNFSNGGFTIGSTGTAPVVDSGASKTFALVAAQSYASSYSGAYTITQAAGAGASVTLSGATASGTVDLTGATGTSTINTSATSGAFTLTGAASVDTITVGTGATTVIGKGGADVITLAAGHTAIDTITYDSANQGGAAVTYSGAAVLAAGDTVTNFVTAQDVVNVNGFVTTGHTSATFTQGNWNATTNGAGILSGTYLSGGAGSTLTQISAAIGNFTVSANSKVVAFIETAAASGIYIGVEVNSVTAIAGAALSTTDGTISLIGTFSGTAANWATGNVVA